MDKNFLVLMELLCDENQPLPVQRIAELSDLDKEHSDQIAKTWNSIPVKRRQLILQTMGQQAFDHFELSFEAINRIALFDSDPLARSIAIENLWECEDPSIVPALLESLSFAGDSQVRAVAAKALGAFIWLGEIGEIQPEFLNQIEAGLLSTCRKDEPEVRMRSLESLGYSSHDDVPALIEEAYNSGDESRLQSAMLAMGRSANDRWNQYVLAELTNPSPFVRMEAARAAGELEIREAIDNLIDLLQDVNDQIRVAAIWALAEIGGDDAMDAIVELGELTDDDGLQTIIEEAIDHMTFVSGSRNLLLLDFDEDEDTEAPTH